MINKILLFAFILFSQTAVQAQTNTRPTIYWYYTFSTSLVAQIKLDPTITEESSSPVMSGAIPDSQNIRKPKSEERMGFRGSMAEEAPLAPSSNTSNFPSYFSEETNNDQLMRILITHLPQFHHQFVYASHTRSLEMVKTQPNSCYSLLLKNSERESALQLSHPFFQNLPIGLIVMRSKLAQFKPFLNKHNQVQLNKLLQKQTYRLVTVADRSFGEEIDQIVSNHASSNSKSLVSLPSSYGFPNRLLKLINQQEYDALLGYAYELDYAVNHWSLKAQDFVFIPIAEQSHNQKSHIACAKSEIGKQVISAINTLLSSPPIKQEIHAFHQSLLTADKAARNYYAVTPSGRLDEKK